MVAQTKLKMLRNMISSFYLRFSTGILLVASCFIILLMFAIFWLYPEIDIIREGLQYAPIRDNFIIQNQYGTHDNYIYFARIRHFIDGDFFNNDPVVYEGKSQPSAFSTFAVSYILGALGGIFRNDTWDAFRFAFAIYPIVAFLLFYYMAKCIGASKEQAISAALLVIVCSFPGNAARITNILTSNIPWALFGISLALILRGTSGNWIKFIFAVTLALMPLTSISSALAAACITITALVMTKGKIRCTIFFTGLIGGLLISPLLPWVYWSGRGVDQFREAARIDGTYYLAISMIYSIIFLVSAYIARKSPRKLFYWSVILGSTLAIWIGIIAHSYCLGYDSFWRGSTALLIVSMTLLYLEKIAEITHDTKIAYKNNFYDGEVFSKYFSHFVPIIVLCYALSLAYGSFWSYRLEWRGARSHIMDENKFVELAKFCQHNMGPKDVIVTLDADLIENLPSYTPAYFYVGNIVQSTVSFDEIKNRFAQAAVFMGVQRDEFKGVVDGLSIYNYKYRPTVAEIFRWNEFLLLKKVIYHSINLNISNGHTYGSDKEKLYLKDLMQRFDKYKDLVQEGLPYRSTHVLMSSHALLQPAPNSKIWQKIIGPPIFDNNVYKIYKLCGTLKNN